MVQATFHVSVIHLIHTNLPHAFFPEKNKQSTLTNHFGQPSVNLTKPNSSCGERPRPIWNYPHQLFNHIALRQLSGLGEQDYIVLSGIPTTDFGEQSTRAASRQDKLHRLLPLIYGLSYPTPLLLCIKLVAPLVSSLASVGVHIGLGINALLVHICPGYCKRTFAIWVRKHTLQEALKGNRGRNAYLGTCIGVFYPPPPLS